MLSEKIFNKQSVLFSSGLGMFFFFLLCSSTAHAAKSEKEKIIEERLIAPAPVYAAEKVIVPMVSARLDAAKKVVEVLNLDASVGEKILNDYKAELTAELESSYKSFVAGVEKARADQIKELKDKFSLQELQAIADFYSSDMGTDFSQIAVKQSQAISTVSSQFQTGLAASVRTQHEGLIESAKQAAAEQAAIRNSSTELTSKNNDQSNK